MRKWLFYLLAGYVWKRLTQRKVTTTAPMGRSTKPLRPR